MDSPGCMAEECHTGTRPPNQPPRTEQAAQLRGTAQGSILKQAGGLSWREAWLVHGPVSQRTRGWGALLSSPAPVSLQSFFASVRVYLLLRPRTPNPSVSHIPVQGTGGPASQRTCILCLLAAPSVSSLCRLIHALKSQAAIFFAASYIVPLTPPFCIHLRVRLFNPQHHG